MTTMTPHETFAKAYGQLARARREVERAKSNLAAATYREEVAQKVVDEAWMKFNERVCSDE